MPSKSKSTRSRAATATATAAASNSGTSTSNADTNTLLREMHEELIHLRAAQTATNEQIKEMQNIQNSAIENLRAELGAVRGLLNNTTKKLVEMQNTQKDLIQRLESFEGNTSSTPPPTEPTESLPSTAQPSQSNIPRPLRREGAFLGLRDLKRRDPHSDVYGREGPAYTDRPTPESMAHSPPMDLEELQVNRTTFPTSSERDNNGTSNAVGRKRTRDDMDPPPAASTSYNPDGDIGSAHSPKRRRAGRVADPVSPQSRDSSAGDMAPPPVVSSPRSDTPRPEETTGVESSSSYIRGVVSSVLP